MKWSIMGFGKYKGKTLPHIMFKDPDWFFWAYENRAFKGDLLRQAQEIYGKASSIHVPQNGDEKRFVEYIVDAWTGKFGTIRIITGDIDIYKPMTGNLVLEVNLRAPKLSGRKTVRLKRHAVLSYHGNRTFDGEKRDKECKEKS